MASSINITGALIGCGYFAQNHMHAWTKHIQHAKITCLCDSDAQKLELTALTFGIAKDKCYTSLQELLEKEKNLNFYDVVTQPASHKTIVEQLATHANGTHIMCQKPMAPTVEDAEFMVMVCKEKKKTLMIHENFRWQPALRALKNAITETGMGQPFWGNVSFRSCFDVYADQPYLATDDRFIIFDLGVHMIDLARFLMGDAHEIYCRKQRVNQKVVAEDCATMMLGMDNGSTCVVDVSYFSKLEKERFPQTIIALEGPNGSCRLDSDFLLTTVDSAGFVKKKIIDLPEEDWMTSKGTLIQASIAPTQQHFVDCIRSGETPETNGDDNLQTLKLALAAYTSADKNIPIIIH